MKLEDYLEKSGFTRSSLAKELGLSRQAISKWEDIPTNWLSRLDGLEPVVVEKQKEWDEFSFEEMTRLIKMRGRDSTDYEVAKSVGLKVWEFRRLIDRWVKIKAEES